MTLKPEIVFVNQGDATVGQPLPDELLRAGPERVARRRPSWKWNSPSCPPEDRETFMADLGITGSSRDATLRGIFAAMGHIVFFTVGEDECRAWPMPRGADAVEGAGSIHTDFAKRSSGPRSSATTTSSKPAA